MSSPPAIPVLPAPSVERLVRIIDGLCAAIAARGVGGLVTAPLLFRLWSWLRHTATRATRVAARLAAGAPPAVVRHRAASPRPPAPRLPRGYAWLVRLVPGTAAYGAQLQTLLADPLMAPLIGAPGMRRLLNPLCRMLGVPKPPPLPAARPAAIAPEPRQPDRGGGRTPAGWHPPPSAAPAAA